MVRGNKSASHQLLKHHSNAISLINVKIFLQNKLRTEYLYTQDLLGISNSKRKFVYTASVLTLKT